MADGLARNPSEIGARAEMAVASALQRAGWAVFVPLFAPDSRVDLVAISTGRVLRVQCKAARLEGGALVFRTCSNTRNRPVDYRRQIDAFGVHAPALEQVYLVPVDSVPVRGGRLRLAPTRNGQVAGVRWAVDFLVGPP